MEARPFGCSSYIVSLVRLTASAQSLFDAMQIAGRRCTHQPGRHVASKTTNFPDKMASAASCARVATLTVLILLAATCHVEASAAAPAAASPVVKMWTAATPCPATQSAIMAATAHGLTVSVDFYSRSTKEGMFSSLGHYQEYAKVRVGSAREARSCTRRRVNTAPHP